MSRVDLSKLPEPLRQKIEARLAQLPSELRGQLLNGLGKIPPQMLEALLERGSPMLDKLFDKIEKDLPTSTHSSTTTGGPPLKAVNRAAPIVPAGHYNKTVQRG